MKKELITHEDPKSPVSEIFRTLRTNIQFMNTDEEIDTILITSTLPGEGKSWVASNLAVTFAQAGKKVILIDADMRKGRQYNIFGVSPRPGLSNYLSGVINGEKMRNSKNINLFIKETQIDNLYLIPAGNVPPNPSELLVSQKMDKLIRDLKHEYDVIMFDGTPSLLVADAIILSRLVDTTLIVSAHKETKMDNLDKIKKTIENVGGNVAGVILNKIPISSKKYEDIYYYGNSAGQSFDVKNIDQIKKQIDKKENNKKSTSKKEDIKNTKQPKKVNKNNSYNETTIKRTIKNIEISEQKEDEEEKIKSIRVKKENNNPLNELNGTELRDEEIDEKVAERSRDILSQINKYLDNN